MRRTVVISYPLSTVAIHASGRTDNWRAPRVQASKQILSLISLSHVPPLVCVLHLLMLQKLHGQYHWATLVCGWFSFCTVRSFTFPLQLSAENRIVAVPKKWNGTLESLFVQSGQSDSDPRIPGLMGFIELPSGHDVSDVPLIAEFNGTRASALCS